MVDAVLELVALDVTVNVAALDWLAVNVCEPDKPVPDTPIVSVPLPISTVPHEVFVPLVVRNLPECVACDGANALNAPFAEVCPVPPEATARVEDNPAAVPVVF